MKVQREKVEQAHIVQLAATLGAKVYVIGTRRGRGKPCPKCGTFVAEHQGTRQTEGIADLHMFLKLPSRTPMQSPVPKCFPSRLFLMWETKAPGGRMSSEQKDLATLAGDAGVCHGSGDFDAFITWLIAHDFVRADQFPHYRQPKQEAR